MAIELLCSDLDGTLIGNPDSLGDFCATWKVLRDNGGAPLLVYNSGRLLEDLQRTVRRHEMVSADFLICGVGTLVYDCREEKPLIGFSKILSEGWDWKGAAQVVKETFESAKQQPHQFQTPFKCSWYLNDASPEDIARLRQALKTAGYRASVIYSSSRDLDVIPKLADKGNALKWLLDHLGLHPSQAAVAGDTGNDSAMYQLPDLGLRIMLENAQPELIESTQGLDVYQARAPFAGGVLEGLQEHGVFPEVTRREEEKAKAESSSQDRKLIQLFEDEPEAVPESDEDAYLKKAYDRALEGLRRCMTEKGFSACSIEDNQATGTDENYHSVWGRDGCIAVLGVLDLKDEDVRRCREQTLITLLDHISPNGQIPANVSVRTGEPDYSGVGGIAAIDSAMWLIIALYEHCRESGDLALARRYRHSLQRAMDWLSAHDSNNDALIEVPEAGDWMDLFNRSYNVLVDEVIWYRTNIAFGSLLEYLGEKDRARGYLVWAESIKNAINQRFWPTLSDAEVANPLRQFAERQHSLGDSHYYIAQITPFGFDWRCDVFGNVLAYLFNVSDGERARKSFRFMWGSGVNEPFPVQNLYPVVNAGDPDWRAYYTVNFLNLPHHYHNGGIWPFVGALWVRYIRRLGFREEAKEELVKLAQLNQRGVSGEWEFNEWCHGLTGRPMGKSYQAWSCAGYIAAYHDVMN